MAQVQEALVKFGWLLVFAPGSGKFGIHSPHKDFPDAEAARAAGREAAKDHPGASVVVCEDRSAELQFITRQLPKG